MKQVVFFCLLLGLVLQACRSRKPVEEYRIEDSGRSGLIRWVGSPYATVDLDEAGERPYADFIDSIRYVPLGDECGVMGNIDKILAYNGRYYIKENHFNRIFVYDISGHCLNKIDHQGRGPGEYLWVSNIAIDKERKELIVVDAGNSQILFYDLDGNFKYVRRLSTIIIDNSLPLHDSTFLHILSGSQREPELQDYALMVSKGNEYTSKGANYLPFQKGPTNGGTIFEGNGRLCYFPLYADTLYQVLSDTIYGPAYYFKKKHTMWKKYRKSDKFIDDWDVDRNDLGVFPWLFENRDFLLGFIPDPKTSGHEMQHFLYDRQLDKTYLLRKEKYEFASVVDRYEGSDMVGRDEDWFIGYAAYSFFDNDGIFDRIQKGFLKITDPDLERILKSMDIDSNPVLILTKFKHL